MAPGLNLDFKNLLDYTLNNFTGTLYSPFMSFGCKYLNDKKKDNKENKRTFQALFQIQ